MVYQVKQLFESLTGRVAIEHLSENSFGSLVPARGYFHLKSLGDLMLALLVLPIALPVMAGIALAIRLDSPGPVLFRQPRVGQAGKRFNMLKFRTMVHGDGERRARRGDHQRRRRAGHQGRRMASRAAGSTSCRRSSTSSLAR